MAAPAGPRRPGSGIGDGDCLDARLGRSVLADLRSHPPPSLAEAAPELAAAAAQRGGPSPRGPPRAAAAAAAGPHGAAAAPQRGVDARPGARSRSASKDHLLPRAGAHVLASPVARPPLPADKRLSTPSAGAAAGRGRGGSDESLVASMAARLAQVEQLNKQLSARVARQAQELTAVRGELERAREAPSARPEDGAVAATPAECAGCRALRRQVDELSGIVEAYGLVWTPAAAAAEEEQAASGGGGGGGGPAAAPAAGGAAAGSPAPARERGIHRPEGHKPSEGGVSVDIEVLRSRVEGLNASLEDVRPGVVAEGGRARLAADAAGPLPVTFFQDGVQLADRAFAPYESRPAQTVLRDVLDGYFPQALREQFPAGAALKVVDRTGSAYRAWLRDLAACDPELADGGSRLRPSAGRAVNAPADKRTPAERFLAKLPEKVVRGGQVVDVRGAIAEKLMPGGAAARGSSEPPAAGGAGDAGAQARGSEVSLLAAGRDPGAPSARLQVRLEGGQRVLLLMEPGATVGELWQALGRWRAEHGVARAGDDGRQCCLRSAFPPRAFAVMSQTLQEAGLVPSAALFVSAGACDC